MPVNLPERLNFVRGISLANKCILLFGAAVVLIILAALTVPWLRMNALVDENEMEIARLVAASVRAPSGEPGSAEAGLGRAGEARWIPIDEAHALAGEDPVLRRALSFFEREPDAAEFTHAGWERTTRHYQLVRPVREGGRQLSAVIVVDRVPPGAAAQLVVNTVYLISAGAVALGLAVLVFYLITSRLILSPVRELKATAERVREGNLATRSSISTGDEFEELGVTFNAMLGALEKTQDQLRAVNRSLDLKVSELAERNHALYEANQLKGEFLANVSHELRTPLNSIIGFTELLAEIAQQESEQASASGGATPPQAAALDKRRRYLQHILTSARSLLDLINSLLEMARIEAGKLELHPEPISLRDACETMLALVRPQADKMGVELLLEAGPGLPVIHTDPQKFQQIVFNLLSNAVKFTGAAGADGGAARSRPRLVTLRAERLIPRASDGPAAEERVRVSVLDTGPGIAPEHQQVIFEKFQQVEGGHDRRHGGAGLGLAIARELTSMLQGEILVESQVGRGSMFSIILPLRLDPDRARESRLEMEFRGRLAGQRPARS